jgi:hypothetical protein
MCSNDGDRRGGRGGGGRGAEALGSAAAPQTSLATSAALVRWPPPQRISRNCFSVLICARRGAVQSSNTRQPHVWRCELIISLIWFRSWFEFSGHLYNCNRAGRSIRRAGCSDSVQIFCGGPPFARACQSVTFLFLASITFD